MLNNPENKQYCICIHAKLDSPNQNLLWYFFYCLYGELVVTEFIKGHGNEFLFILESSYTGIT